MLFSTPCQLLGWEGQPHIILQMQGQGHKPLEAMLFLGLSGKSVTLGIPGTKER